MKRIAATLFVFSAATPTMADRLSASIDLVYGEPKRETVNGIRLNYDGRDQLLIGSGKGILRLLAMTPAQVMVSPNRRFIAHNFGNGSGQIYDLRVYALRTGRRLDVSKFKKHVFAFAHSSPSCRARPTEISFLVNRWLSPDALQIGTEDWTQKPGCEHLFRKWTLAVP